MTLPQSHARSPRLSRFALSFLACASSFLRATPRDSRISSLQLAYKLPILYLRRVEACHIEFENYLREFIAERRLLAADPRESETRQKDLLGALLHASADLDNDENGERSGEKGGENKKILFSDDEIVESMYAFVVAGHGELRFRRAFFLELVR